MSQEPSKEPNDTHIGSALLVKPLIGLIFMFMLF